MKTALVTGASTGIGRAVAIELGKKGYKVVLVARNKEKLEETKSLVGNAEVFVCDLTDIDQINDLIAKVTMLDLIVNVAGIWHGKDRAYSGINIADFDQKIISDTYQVGVVAPTFLVSGLVNLMPKGSSIVNISGTFENGAKGWIPYFTSKRALEDLTLGLAEDLKDKGIRVNCVSPSDTATEEYIKYFPEDAADANTPEQVAKLVVDVAEKDETGKFWVIKKGKISEGFHS